MARELCTGFQNPRFKMLRMRLAHNSYHKVFQYDSRLKYEFLTPDTGNRFERQVLENEEFYDLYCTRILENSGMRFFSTISTEGNQMLFSEKAFVLTLVHQPPTDFLRALVETNIRPIDEHIRWMAAEGYDLYSLAPEENHEFYRPLLCRFSWRDKRFFVFRNMGEGAKIERVVDETGAFAV